MDICDLQVMVRSSESYVVPPSRVEITPLPPGEMEIEGSRVIYRGSIDIHCSYFDEHRIVLPRRSVVSAVYTMHLPPGYELRRIPSSTTARLVIPSTSLQDRPSTSSHPLRRQIGSAERAPRAFARRTEAGPVSVPPGFAERSVAVPDCQCSFCRRHLVSPPDSSAPAARGTPETVLGSSSRQERRRGRDDEADVRGSPKRARPSPLTSAPAAGPRMTRDLVIKISSDEEEGREEDPDEGEASGVICSDDRSMYDFWPVLICLVYLLRLLLY